MSAEYESTEIYGLSITPMIALWGHWLSVSIGQSETFIQGLDPHKRRYRIGRLKAGSADRRLEALATLSATTAALPRDLNLTVPCNINLLKTDSRLTVIASQLITSYTELKPFVFVVHDFF